MQSGVVAKLLPFVFLYIFAKNKIYEKKNNRYHN
jgi:hypothetical protein